MRKVTHQMFKCFLKLWQLTPAGKPIITHSSQLLPVRLPDSGSAILKIALEDEEQQSHILLNWWAGKGAVKVFAQHNQAILLEKAQDKESLLTMATNGQDDQATTIICQVIKQLHSLKISLSLLI